jgi:hypothetical protein
MVIQTRTELRRNRILYFLTIILAATVLIAAIAKFSGRSEATQAFLIVISIIAVFALAITLIQLFAYPRRSHALIIHSDEEMILATNARHEGFKLRLLRDLLSENVYAFSDEARIHWKSLEEDGYHPSMVIRGVRKVFLLRLCTMMFDDVFVVDSEDRWEHHDSSSTSEPTFHKREMPPMRAWKKRGNISA